MIRIWRSISEWIIRRTGLYRLDVLLWRRKAARLDKLADEVAWASVDGAAKLRASATRWRTLANERAAWR